MNLCCWSRRSGLLVLAMAYKMLLLLLFPIEFYFILTKNSSGDNNIICYIYDKSYNYCCYFYCYCHYYYRYYYYYSYDSSILLYLLSVLLLLLYFYHYHYHLSYCSKQSNRRNLVVVIDTDVLLSDVTDARLTVRVECVSKCVSPLCSCVKG